MKNSMSGKSSAAILLMFLLYLPGHGQEPYILKQSTFTTGGQTLTDTLNYKLFAVTGQPLIGQGGNDEYLSKAGFLYQVYGMISGLDKISDLLPVKFQLFQNFPNPFNPQTRIKFALPKAADVKIVVFDILGQEVLDLLDERREAGFHAVDFIAGQLASGMYFYTIQAGPNRAVKKMILVR